MIRSTFDLSGKTIRHSENVINNESKIGQVQRENLELGQMKMQTIDFERKDNKMKHTANFRFRMCSF